MTETTEQTRTCSNCMWWEHIEEIVSQRLGSCHGGPPSVTIVSGPNYRQWPVTEELEWCGSFRMKEPGQ